MKRRSNILAAALVAILCHAAPAAAQQIAPAAGSGPARTLTPQQERMGHCNSINKGKKGDDYKHAVSQCLRGEDTPPAHSLTPQQQRMKDCNANAASQSMKGAARQTFMRDCLGGKTQ